MESERLQRALLLGLVEVRQPLEQLDEEGRARMYALCHMASVAGHVDDMGWLGWHERGLMGVEVLLDQENLQLTSNEVLVSRHSLEDVSGIVVVQGTEGHLVVVGHCQVNGQVLAAVLDMMSQVDALQLEEDVRQRLSRLRHPTEPCAPQDTVSSMTVPTAPPLTELGSSTNIPYTRGTSVLQQSEQDSINVSVLPQPTSTQPSSSLVQPSSCSNDSPNLPSHPTEIPSLLRAKSPAANIRPSNKFLATPLRCSFHPSVSRLGHSPVFTFPVSKSPVSTAPVSTLKVSTPLVSLRSVSTRPVSTRPMSSPSAPTLPVSNPPLFPQRTSMQPVPSLPVSTPLVSTRLVSATTNAAPPVSRRSLSKPTLPARPANISALSSRQVTLSKAFTPLVSTLPVSVTSVSTSVVSNSSVSTSRFPPRPISFPRAITPLVLNPTVSNTTVSTTPVCPSSVTTRPTLSRFVSKPIISTKPVSFPKVLPTQVSTTSVSIATVSNTEVSTTTVSIVSVSTTSTSTTPLSYTAVSTTPLSTPSISDQSASTVSSSVFNPHVTTVSESILPTSSPSASTVAANPEFRRYSVASLSSLEEDNSNICEKAELILGTLNVKESEFMFIPSLKHTQEQDSSSSMEHELSILLENEHQYLDTLGRITDARSVVKPELQNLLRRNESLADFHRNLFRDLHQEFPSCSGVARVFLSRKEDLEQYRYYLMNAPLVLRQLGQQREEVKSQYPTLEADLKSSWKRLHYYFMTFDKLAKIVSPEEQPLVQEVVDLLRDMNRQGDSAILIDGVSGAPFSLHTLGSLLLHGLFVIKDSSGVLKAKAKHHVLLFEEMMVITLPKKETYHYKDHLPIRQLYLRQADSDETTFVLDFMQGGNKKNRRFTFKCRQQESKDAWVNEISRLHLEYAKEVKRLSKLRYGWQ